MACLTHRFVGCPRTSDALAGRVITLISAVLTDLSAVRTWQDFADYLNDIHRATGMSLNDIQKASQTLPRDNHLFRVLPTSTLSDALNGKRPIKKEVLASLLAVWQMPHPQRERVVGLWQRLSVELGQGPPGAGRVDESSARELGVHPAISIDNAADELPSYVQREFDERLRDHLASGVQRGCFVLLLGGSSCGKTRSLYEAVREIVPDWWLAQPSKTQEIRDLAARPTERTVLWLDELQRYLSTDPPLRKAEVVALVRAGVIVVATLWPRYYLEHKRFSTEPSDDHGEVRSLLEFAEKVDVRDNLDDDERERAATLAVSDPRIQAALAVSDAGLTQVLAAGPDLVSFWEHASDPYSKAIITVAADARRLGVQMPLPTELLVEAMTDYLTPRQRVEPPAAWASKAVHLAVGQLHGAVSPLIPMSIREPGTLAGYVVADYLTQHIGRVRRADCPPDSLWRALLAHATDTDDLRALAGSALVRMRYAYAEMAYRKLHDLGDQTVVPELMTILRQQDRLGEAMALVEAWEANNPLEVRRRKVRAELSDLVARAERMRPQDTGDSDSGELLFELLADGGRADTLRIRAEAGDVIAVEDLADLLGDRGCLTELAELAIGSPYAAERMAELLARLGRSEELRRLASAGNVAAEQHFARLEERLQGVGELSRLRADSDAGAEDAADELTTLLFESGDVRGLLDEINAGTRHAIARYLALLTSDPHADRARIRRIRAFGMRADGQPGDAGALR
jgi:hypothetical protein